ncbi:YARHG domain-containing protein [Lachnospiraceae bacterium XBB2008]|nr:YARHG domain-containing protein [Lachnospiraceae bacterium XBB2008]
MINRAKISGTICVLMGITMLTGCGLADKIPGNDTAEEPAAQVETAADVDGDTAADIGEEPEGTPVISFESGGPGFKSGNDADEPAEETSDVYDYETVYAPILSEIKEVLTSGYDYEKDYAYISTGLMERCMYPEDDVLPEVIGYTYMDINGDDIPELLIGENDGYEYDDTQYVSYIYSGFTIIDDEPVLFLEGWARNRYHWMGDGYFFNTGSGGAMNTIFGQGHLPPGGDSIEWDDFYFSEEDMAIGGMAFFHNNTGSCDPGESERLNMSEHKFLRILNSYKCEPVSWTFFEGASGPSPVLDGTALSDKELKTIEKKLNHVGYYGFLRSTYSDPRYIDWSEVFYVGAGFEQGPASKDIVDAYLKAAGYDELMTDLTIVFGDSVKWYVKATTGYDYSEMKKPLDWVYLKEYDLYCYEHGDTNQSQVSVVSGVVNGDEYTVTYKNERGELYCVTFVEEDDMYRFISNLPESIAHGGSDIDQSTLTDGMLIPDSDSRYLTEDDLKGFTAEELRIARNEIYARYGRKFNDSKLQEHFNSMDWYFPTTEPGDFDENILNDYEIKNLDLIAKYEKKVQ